MDADESVAKLKAARDLGTKLTEAARHGQAHGLSTHDDGQAMDKYTAAVDLSQRGKHEGTVGGQPAQQQDADRNFTDPVHAFADPVILMDTPSAAAFTSEAQFASISGQDHSVTAHGDSQQTAAHTWSSVSGKTTSLYAHEGGIKAFAANGPVSIQAHTDTMQILADQELTILSINDEIYIDAPNRIELFDGHSSIVLEGGDITMVMPGLYSAPMSTHEFMAAGGGSPDLSSLPQGTVKEPPNFIEVNYHDPRLKPREGYPYRIVFEDGTTLSGKLDGAGHAKHEGVPNQNAKVYFGESPKPFKPDPVSTVEVDEKTARGELDALGLDGEHNDLQGLVEREAGRAYD